MREIAALRSKLREINIEYSRFVRKGAEERLARLGELSAERRGLMALIAQALACADIGERDLTATQISRTGRQSASQPTPLNHLRQRPGLSEGTVGRSPAGAPGVGAV